MEWVVKGTLARSSRPRYPDHAVSRETVEKEVGIWREAGIRSIICLLDDRQLAYYADIADGLLGCYKEIGFHVTHIPVQDYKIPPLSEKDQEQIAKAYGNPPNPVLIHCSAGIDRTGMAVEMLVE